MKLRLYVIMDVIIMVGLRKICQIKNGEMYAILYDYNEQELIDLAQRHKY